MATYHDKLDYWSQKDPYAPPSIPSEEVTSTHRRRGGRVEAEERR